MSTHKTGTGPTKKMLNDNRGFTLVELMIVIAILGVLAAIAIPVYKNYIAISKQNSAKSVLEQLPVLVESYRAENGMMCPSCNSNGTYTYRYTEGTDGVENTTPIADKFTTFFPDFRAKGLTAGVSIYHYQIMFNVVGCPNCTESATATALPQTGRGAPPGNIVGNTFD